MIIPPDHDHADTSAIANVARVRTLLIAAAQAGEAVSYSCVLNGLGLTFTRPRMRALCRTLDRIDTDGAARGQPELAVLVVRQSDGLPGQGWWAAHTRNTGHPGPWTGPQAAQTVDRLQQAAFAYWREDEASLAAPTPSRP